MSVARQYYHARKRSDESPLEFLYRLNVAGLRTRLQIKDGPSEVRREHASYMTEMLSLQSARSVNHSTVGQRAHTCLITDSLPVAAAFSLLPIVDRKGHPSDRYLFTCKACGDIHEAGKCTMEEFYNLIRQWYNPTKHAGMLPETAEKIYCIYAYAEKQSEATVNQLIDPIDNTCDLHEKSTATVSSLRQIDEYARSSVMMALEISPGESRGYLKYHIPDKKFKQSKAMGKINNSKATLLFDSGAEVSILDATFARKVGCHIDENQTLECEGVGRSPCKIEGRTRLKITLAGSLVCFFYAWVGPPTGGQDLILGMDFMVPAGIRLDLADWTICLPDEVRLQMAGRRPLFGDKIEHVCWKDHYWIDVGQTAEIRLRGQISNQYKLWVTRGDRWVPTITTGPGKTRYLQVTNGSDRALTLHEGSRVAMWLSGDQIPRIPGYVSIGSRRYAEWQNLAYQATTDEISEVDTDEQIIEPAVERPEYVTPTAILPRPVKAVQSVEIAGDGDTSLPLSKRTSDQGKIDRIGSNDLHTKIEANIADPTMEDEVCIKEGGSLFAEDVEDQMAVLPDVTAITEEVMIEDLQIGDTNINTQEEIERLVQIIWKRKHLLIGKGNVLPPAAKGVVCDIDVGNAKPVAQRSRKVAI
ncbi:Hypothetical protein PHPALM_1656 [Phytophthora palmivora]|uniref:Peptidase A2 domain-containing protein n=1 Tax=Phytophthora palmivora TaxID=4796 RepID=A0A2P4YRQ8_9STRA|nr:Hypothetical protein PHPALM_1656 [Phytophthora palmivora]